MTGTGPRAPGPAARAVWTHMTVTREAAGCAAMGKVWDSDRDWLRTLPWTRDATGPTQSEEDPGRPAGRGP